MAVTTRGNLSGCIRAIVSIYLSKEILRCISSVKKLYASGWLRSIKASLANSSARIAASSGLFFKPVPRGRHELHARANKVSEINRITFRIVQPFISSYVRRLSAHPPSRAHGCRRQCGRARFRAGLDQPARTRRWRWGSACESGSRKAD